MLVVLSHDLGNVSACEMQKSLAEQSQIFRRHLLGTCSLEDQKKMAVSAEVLLQALQDGKSLDLRGVVIDGDLLFDRLPLQPLSNLVQASSRAQQIIAERQVEMGRVIPGSIMLQDVVAHGNWATNLRGSLLVFFGPFTVIRTRFEQSIDFSHTLFLGAVDFSDSIIQYEGFFVNAQFVRPVRFSKTALGTHSRFHKAQFAELANFSESRFHGLAEFLEVVFTQRADFSGAQFHMGTGFSGTQFNGPAMFSRAEFQREVFFRFARFGNHANFGEVNFNAVSDFSESSFSKTPDFSGTTFQVSPEFSQSNLDEHIIAEFKPKTVSRKLVILFTFLGICCLVAWAIQKWRKSS